MTGKDLAGQIAEKLQEEVQADLQGGAILHLHGVQVHSGFGVHAGGAAVHGLHHHGGSKLLAAVVVGAIAEQPAVHRGLHQQGHHQSD